MAKIAFLLSRQPRHLTSSDWWIHAVDSACRWAIDRGLTLLSHIGFHNAGFPPWRYSRLGGQISEVQEMDDLARADIIIAVAVRSGGNMLRIGLDALKRRREVFVLMPPIHSTRDSTYDGNRILLDHGARMLALQILQPARASPVDRHQSESADISPCGYLWHCTRSRPGPWPGESIDDYYTSLLENKPGAGHSARDALDRILEEKRIRSNGAMIRGNYPVVCFSSRDPEELLSMRSYKPALLRWDFEPCAIGIRREAALAAGVRSVCYLPPHEFDRIPDEEKYLYQKHDPPDVDYSAEEEWRCLGDLDLNKFKENETYVYR